VSTHNENEALSQEELEAQDGSNLPNREAMSTLPISGVDPAGTVDAVGDTVGGVVDGATGGAVGGAVGGVGDAAGGALGGAGSLLGGAGLLDLNVNVDLNADAAAPISAAVAANANVAAPIDAAVSANVASPDGVSVASAPQVSLIEQNLDGVASANVDQTSDIAQGAGSADGGASADAAAAPAPADSLVAPDDPTPDGGGAPSPVAETGADPAPPVDSTDPVPGGNES
jgi:hypothetical protein